MAAAGSPVLGASAIPGDPSGLSALVARFRSASADVESVHNRVSSNGLQGSWSGSAAEAFRSSLHTLPDELANVSAAFSDAAQSVSAFTAKLESQQHLASWYAQQISSARSELDVARAREAAAQSQLNTARRAHATAIDPVSLSTARSAVAAGTSLVSQAAADAEAIDTEIERLFAQAAANHSEYLSGVSACCAALSFGYGSGGHPWASWFGAVTGIMGYIEGKAQDAGELGAELSKTYVSSYVRSDGTVVAAYLRSNSASDFFDRADGFLRPVGWGVTFAGATGQQWSQDAGDRALSPGERDVRALAAGVYVGTLSLAGSMVGQRVGARFGGFFGMAIGGVIGSVIPVAGNVDGATVGAGVGTAVGSVVGAGLGGAAGEWVGDETKGWVVGAAGDAWHGASSATGAIAHGVTHALSDLDPF